MQRNIVLLLMLFVVAICVAGCGGSGGSDGTAGEVSGTVTDVAGNLIPGAKITVDGSRVSATSLMNGTYKLYGAPTGDWINLRATATIDGRQWVGLSAAQIFSDGPTQNISIVMAQVSQTGRISGTVRDTAGNGIGGARIFATAVFPDYPTSKDSPSQVTLTTIADRSGNYTLTNVPASILTEIGNQTIKYDLTASSIGRSGQYGGFDNVMESGVTVVAGGETRVSFVLSASPYDDLLEPYGWTDPDAILALSFTLPSGINSRSYSGYKGVMATVSPKMRKVLAASKSPSRVPPSGSIIEINVLWGAFNWLGSNDNVAGFGIYRRANSWPTISDRDQLDFVRDPDVVSYADTSNSLSVGVNYYYGVTAVSTSYLDAYDQYNPLAESSMSGVASVKPIGQLNLVEPLQSATVRTDSPRFSWQSLPGAKGYQLIVYNDYPIFEVSTSQGSENRPIHLPDYVTVETTGTSAMLNVSLAPGTYWWTVIAGDEVDLGNEALAYSIGELRQLRVSY